MKTCILPLVSFYTCVALTANAQDRRSESADWVITKRGSHHAVHERTEVIDLGNGRTEEVNHRYVELASGLNYWDEGQWKESREEFVVSRDGYAVATQGQTKLIISPILNDAAGAVDMELSNGQRMRSTILGLVLRDRLTGANLLVAEIRDGVVGQHIAPNEILFKDCFDDVNASVRMTYELGGFHQDVILNRAFSPVWLEENGFNVDTTRLEIWTEFFESPVPEIKSRVISSVDDPSLRSLMAEPDVIEDTLDFGVMKIPMGRAYAGKATSIRKSSVRVPKRWHTVDGRTFLVESISLAELQPLFAGLPNWQPKDNTENRVMTAGLTPPAPVLVNPGTNVILTASLGRKPSEEGVVLDYTTIDSSLTNYIFQGDTTYYVSGTVNLYETTTFEGGTVIKFNPSSASSLVINSGTVVNGGRAYRPVVCTSKNDNSVGETISGSSGSPAIDTVENYYLKLDDAGDVELTNWRMAYAYCGLTVDDCSATVTDIQFVHCDYPVYLIASTGFNLRNALFYDIPQIAFYVEGGDISAEHLTIYDCTELGDKVPTGTLAMTNCLLVEVDGLGDISLTTNTVVMLATNDGVFQTVGGAAHYLADNTYRNAGITGINADLIEALGTKTTYPPIVYSNATINADLVLSPQAQRDTDTPDLGYHYDPLDYAFGGSDVNADITVTAGTVLGWFRTSSGWNHAGHGIHMGDSQTIDFQGTVTEPTYWVRCNLAQEQSTGLWEGGYGPGGLTGWASTAATAPEARLRFTICSMTANDMNHFRDDYGFLTVRATDSEFHSGNLGGYKITVMLTNCFMNRVYGAQIQGGSGNAYEVRNSTWRGGRLKFTPTYPISIVVQDTALEETVLTISGYGANATYAHYDYNAFLTGATNFSIGGANDVITSSFDWQSGTLGDYYLPTGSDLIDEGSQDADDAGLYHFTTTTNQTKEATSPVDIGFHYVATDGSGIPLDYDSDGIPDYLEDANGNGAVDSGETDWQDEDDIGLWVRITEPKHHSNIP